MTALQIHSGLGLKLNGELQAKCTSIEVQYIDSDEVVFLLPGAGKKVASDPQGRYMKVTWDQLVPSLAPPVGTPSLSQVTGFLAKPFDFITKYLESEQVNISVLVIGRDDKIDGENGQIATPSIKQAVGQNVLYSLSWIGEALTPESDALQLLALA